MIDLLPCCRLPPRGRFAVLAALLALAAPADAAEPDAARWRRHAAAATITRDDWGIPHVHGRSDADGVFALSYAQAEDDLARVEANYLTALGRTAKAEGEAALWADLRQRLFVDEGELRAAYAACRRGCAHWRRPGRTGSTSISPPIPGRDLACSPATSRGWR